MFDECKKQSEQIWGFCPVCLVDVLPRGDFETAPCLLWRVLLQWFRQAQSETANFAQNYGALSTGYGMDIELYWIPVCHHRLIGVVSLRIYARWGCTNKSDLWSTNRIRTPGQVVGRFTIFFPKICRCEDLYGLWRFAGKSWEIIWIIDDLLIFVALLRQCECWDLSPMTLSKTEWH